MYILVKKTPLEETRTCLKCVFFVFPIIAFRSPKPMCGCGCGRIFWHGSGGATSGPPCSRMQKDVTTVCLETQLPTLYKKEA